MILREAATTADFALIDQSMKQFVSDMGIVQERMAGATGFDDGIGKVLPQVDDWFKTAMSYLKPPATGLTQLPAPQVVIAKGAAIGEAIDVVVENASAYGFNFRSEAETSGCVQDQSDDAGVCRGRRRTGAGVQMAASFSRPIRQAMASSEEIASGVSPPKSPPGAGTSSAGCWFRSTRPACRWRRWKRPRNATAPSNSRSCGRRSRTNASGRSRRRTMPPRAGADCRGADPDDGNAGGRARQAVARRPDRPAGDDVTDAYQQIKDDFNATVDQLSETVSGIIASANEVSNAAAEISASTTDLSQRTEEQAASLEQTSASLEEIATTVKSNVENAQKANQFATSTRQVAEQAAPSSRARSRRWPGSRNPRARSPTSSA